MIYISTYIWWKFYISIWTFCVYFFSFCFLPPFLDGHTIFFCVYFIICYAGRCDQDEAAGHTGKSFRRGYFNCEILYMRVWHTMWIRENSNDRFKRFDHAVFQDHVANYNHFIFASTVSLATRLGTMVTFVRSREKLNVLYFHLH